MLSVMSQLLSQWSGASSITIYAADYFAMMGTTGDNEALYATAIFGVVKFVSALICAFFLIDYIGRKRSLMTGITLQFVSMLYMALFLLIDTGVANDVPQSPSQKRAAMGAIVMIYISGFGWALGWNSTLRIHRCLVAKTLSSRCSTLADIALQACSTCSTPRSTLSDFVR